jgi:probable O-glycosylation ligase (exosortase A-associated)
MRDIVVVGIVIIGALLALRRPWIGVMLWTWVSLLNPHRYCFGFAYDFPVAAVAAGSTIVGFLLTRDKHSPFSSAPPVLLALFIVWITISWRMGLSPQDDYHQWNKVMKILVMVVLSVALLRTKEQIFAYAWVVGGSLALIGIKGGLFTVAHGGSHRVWGPSGSFIEENNSLALALVMTIPLLRFCQMQLKSKWGSRLMVLSMVLVAASALGSHSRGGLLAIAAMAVMLWWRGRSRLLGGIAILTVGLTLVAFMPDEWGIRMATIETYDEDRSAMGRISAWWVAWRLAFDYPFGVGFDAARPELFAKYSPYPELGTPVAHSIYFQILGHHGFVGLALFISIWVASWTVASSIRKQAVGIPQCKWCADLAGMAQVSLFGYAVGGAFLSLGYFDLPYNVMAMVVLTKAWMLRRGWETDPAQSLKWPIPGLFGPDPKTGKFAPSSSR